MYILNSAKPTAVLLELFFCTNKEDYKKGHEKVNARKLAKLVVTGVDSVG